MAPCGAPSRAASRARSLVDVVDASKVIGRPSADPSSRDEIGRPREIRVDPEGRAAGPRPLHAPKSSPTSAAGTEWVSAPTEIASTPARASSATRASVMPPDASSEGPPARSLDGLADRGRRHVVQEHDVRSGIERLVELIERVDLALDLGGVRGGGARTFDRGPHPSARGDMVVLDENGGAEVVAMVVGAADAHRVALERAQARGRLARVGDARPRPGGHGVDERARLRGDAAHALNEIERDALAHQDRARAAPDRPESRVRGDARALRRVRLDASSEGSTRAKTRAKTGPPQTIIGARATALAEASAAGSMHASVVRSPDARSSSSANATTRSTTGDGSSKAPGIAQAQV